MTWTMKKKKRRQEIQSPGSTLFPTSTLTLLGFVRRLQDKRLTYLVGSEAEARQRQRIGMEIVGKHRDR